MRFQSTTSPSWTVMCFLTAWASLASALPTYSPFRPPPERRPTIGSLIVPLAASVGENVASVFQLASEEGFKVAVSHIVDEAVLDRQKVINSPERHSPDADITPALISPSSRLLLLEVPQAAHRQPLPSWIERERVAGGRLTAKSDITYTSVESQLENLNRIMVRLLISIKASLGTGTAATGSDEPAPSAKIAPEKTLGHRC